MDAALGEADIAFLGHGNYSLCWRVNVPEGTRVIKASAYQAETFESIRRCFQGIRSGDAASQRVALRARLSDALHALMSDRRLMSAMFLRIGQLLGITRITPHVAACIELVGGTDIAARLHARAPVPASAQELLESMDGAPQMVFVEPFYARGTLRQWVAANRGPGLDVALRAVLVQVLYTLAVLQHLCPAGFRHNDLSLDNVYVTRTSAPACVSYAFGDVAHAISWADGTPVVVIADFDFVTLGRRAGVRNRMLSAPWLDSWNVSEAFDPAYDPYFFLVCLRHALAERKDGAPLTEAFIAQVLGDVDAVRKSQQDVRSDLLPLRLLGRPYFDATRTKDPGAADLAFSLPSDTQHALGSMQLQPTIDDAAFFALVR